MQNPKERIEYIHVSLRIPAELKTDLEGHARNQLVNFNSLVNRVLVKYTSFDRIAEHVGAIPLNGRLFAGMLENVPREEMERLGKELGSDLIQETFQFLGLEYDIRGLIKHYFEPMSMFSGWYKFTIVGTGPNRRLMFQHAFGPKWSAFLKAYVSSIIKAATGLDVRALADNHILTIYC